MNDDINNNNNENSSENIENLNNADYDYLIKVLLLGDSNTGKSSIILRYTENSFDSSMVSSIGVDFKIKKIKYENKLIRIQIVRNI